MDDITQSAQELAGQFLGFADTVRAYWITHFDELSAEQRDDLRTRVDDFEDLHDRFSAVAIEERLECVASQVKDLKTATLKARAALATVDRIEDVTRILTAVLGAAQAAAVGDLGGTADQIANLVGSLVPGGDSAKAHG